MSAPYQRSTSVLLQLQISPHGSAASLAARCSALPRPVPCGAVPCGAVSSCLWVPLCVRPPSVQTGSGNVMCFPTKTVLVIISSKSGMWRVSRFRLPRDRTHSDANQMFCCACARGHESPHHHHHPPLFGTRLFCLIINREMVTIDWYHSLLFFFFFF